MSPALTPEMEAAIRKIVREELNGVAERAAKFVADGFGSERRLAETVALFRTMEAASPQSDQQESA